MSERVLTPAQQDRFRRNGFIVLPEVISQNTLDDIREVVAETVPEDLSDFEEMAAGPTDRHYWNDLVDMTPFLPLNERLFQYAEELVGEDRLEPPTEFTQVAVHYPEGGFPSDEDYSATSGYEHSHVDIIQDSGEIMPFTIGATTYLDDVSPRGGGLIVWPGTHWRIAEYLSNHEVEEYSIESVQEIINQNFESQPFEVTGPAGTVVLWHNLLAHTGGANLGKRARLASFTRFTRHDEQATARVAMKDPFKYWKEQADNGQLSREQDSN